VGEGHSKWVGGVTVRTGKYTAETFPAWKGDTVPFQRKLNAALSGSATRGPTDMTETCSMKQGRRQGGGARGGEGARCGRT
jgi:hypothetical protein